MAKNLSELQILTANRLNDGEVVFLKPDLTWSEFVNDSWVADGDGEAARLLEEGEIWVDESFVVSPYLVEVLDEDGRIKPVHYREQMRTKGPTVRKDLGKQARAVGWREKLIPADGAGLSQPNL